MIHDIRREVCYLPIGHQYIIEDEDGLTIIGRHIEGIIHEKCPILTELLLEVISHMGVIPEYPSIWEFDSLIIGVSDPDRILESPLISGDTIELILESHAMRMDRGLESCHSIVYTECDLRSSCHTDRRSWDTPIVGEHDLFVSIDRFAYLADGEIIGVSISQIDDLGGLLISGRAILGEDGSIERLS